MGFLLRCLSRFANQTFLFFRTLLERSENVDFSGVLKESFCHGGDFFTVTEEAQKKNPELYTKNHRLVEFIESNIGDVTVISVAAMLVGTMISKYKRETIGRTTLNHAVQKGQQLGGFAFGSSIVVLLSASYEIPDVVESGGYYQMGETLANNVDVSSV